MGQMNLSLTWGALQKSASKVAITLLMFAGRVGSLSVAMAMTRDRPHPKVRNVPEKILIG